MAIPLRLQAGPVTVRPGCVRRVRRLTHASTAQRLTRAVTLAATVYLCVRVGLSLVAI